MSSYWIILLALLLLYLWHQRTRRQAAARQILLRRRKKEGSVMLELAKRFLGQECLIYTLTSQISGTITEITDGAILLESGGQSEILNPDYILRIREYPRNKNGKKRSVVID